MTEQLSIVDDKQARVVSTPAELATLRESKGLSIAGTAAQLRLAPRQVEALEQGAWDKLPGTAFIKGALRSYGKFLRADLSPLISSLDQQLEKTEVKADRSLEGKLPETSALGFGEGGSGSKWVWGVLAALGVGVAALYYGQGVDGLMPKKPSMDLPSAAGSRTEAIAPMPAPGAASSQGAGAQPATASVEPAASTPGAGVSSDKLPDAKAPESLPSDAKAAESKAVEPRAADTTVSDKNGGTVPQAANGPADGSYQLSFAKDSWVEIKDAGGERVLYGVQPAGSSKMIKGKAPFKAVIGNAAHVKIVRKAEGGDQPVPMPKEAAQGTARMSLN